MTDSKRHMTDEEERSMESALKKSVEILPDSKTPLSEHHTCSRCGWTDENVKEWAPLSFSPRTPWFEHIAEDGKDCRPLKGKQAEVKMKAYSKELFVLRENEGTDDEFLICETKADRLTSLTVDELCSLNKFSAGRKVVAARYAFIELVDITCHVSVFRHKPKARRK